MCVRDYSHLLYVERLHLDREVAQDGWHLDHFVLGAAEGDVCACVRTCMCVCACACMQFAYLLHVERLHLDREATQEGGLTDQLDHFALRSLGDVVAKLEEFLLLLVLKQKHHEYDILH